MSAPKQYAPKLNIMLARMGSVGWRFTGTETDDDGKNRVYCFRSGKQTLRLGLLTLRDSYATHPGPTEPGVVKHSPKPPAPAPERCPPTRPLAVRRMQGDDKPLAARVERARRFA